MRVLYSNRSRGRLSLQFYVRFFFISVERRALTTFSIGYLVRISRENGYLDGLERILKLKRLREKSSRRFCSSILFESVERKVVTTVLCEILLHIGGEKSSHDVFDWVSRSNQSREWLSRRFGANIKVESVERGVVTTVLYKIPHPIG